jgi:transposase
MEGSNRDDLRKQLKEREAENRDLRERLEQSASELDRLRRENEQLRRELKAAGRGPKCRSGARKPKGPRRRPGRKAGQGPFTCRKAPESAQSEPPIEVPVTTTECPCCGGELQYERTEEATVTDMPEPPQPEVKRYAVEVRRCPRCGQRVRGHHSAIAPDQHGATAHRLGPRVKAAAHVLHYGMGVPVRKAPAILREFTGIAVTQSALTQDALKQSEAAVGKAYQELRAGVASAPVVYTDDTGWRIHGQAAQLMTFDTDEAAVFQIRSQHRNEEVRELIPADYAGVMVTDRGKSYDAEELLGVSQQKCLDHLKRNIDEVLESKTGRARNFGLKLKGVLQEARQLWRDQRAGEAADFQVEVQRIEKELTFHLRRRFLKDDDNQRLLDGVGLQHDRGRVLQFLHDPAVEPTNNRSERNLRGPVIVRQLSHGSKNERGAEAFAAFTSVIQSALKKQVGSSIDMLSNLFRSTRRNVPATEAHAPPV